MQNFEAKRYPNREKFVLGHWLMLAHWLGDDCKYSIADFELYYSITNNDLFPAEAAMQVFSPHMRVGVVTLAIWNAHTHLHFEGMKENFALYILKRPISLLSTEEFQNSMSEILNHDKQPWLEASKGPFMVTATVWSVTIWTCCKHPAFDHGAKYVGLSALWNEVTKVLYL